MNSEFIQAVKAMRHAQKNFHTSVPGSRTRSQWLTEAKMRENYVDRLLTEMDNPQLNLL